MKRTLLSILVIGILFLSACGPSTPPSANEFQLSSGDLRDQITVVEWPSEAYVGEYITIRVKTMSEEFCNRVRNGLMDANDWDTLTHFDNMTYCLELESPHPSEDYPSEGSWKVHRFAYATPDDQFIVAWHCAIPTEWKDGSPLLPGNYKLWLQLLDPCDNKPGFCGADVMVERNIIIRD